MMRSKPIRSKPIRRVYSDFRGVDFANDPSLVLLSRSPDALNVWKNYKDTQGSCIESRPGYRELANFEDKINGMYFYNDKVLIHSGTNLYLWDNFPSEPITPLVPLKNNMNDAKSTFAIFNEKLYIVDGANYLVYDGTNLENVSDTIMEEVENPTGNPSTSGYYELINNEYVRSIDVTVVSGKKYYIIAREPYVPTTTISRSPSGGGEPYQDVNVLQPKRKNTFVADGTSTDYYLDTTKIDSITEVKVNDTVVTNYTVNTTAGKVTFTTAPSAPVLSGTDNVEITFSKTVPGYLDRIAKCTKMVVFDNRLFFAGNPDYPNAVFHSQLNTPNYVSDLAYYQDGTDEAEIKAIVVGNNILWVFKEPSQERDTIFYHTATTDSIGRVYPNFHGNISTGCCSDAINYKDDIVFISKTGLEGISSNDISSQQLLSHKSSLVDNRLVNEEDLDLSMLVEWNGYLMILVNSKIYLGDIRQLYQSVNGYEYEWYYWDIENAQATILKEYKGNLYIGAEDGSIFIVKGTNDNVVEDHTALIAEDNTNRIVVADISDLNVGKNIRIGTTYLDESIAKNRQITSIDSYSEDGITGYEVTFNGDNVNIDVGNYICREDGVINSYWTTPMDNFGYGNKYKTTNKRGGVAKIKTIPNGRIKVAERTNKVLIDKHIKDYTSGGFNYGDIDYSNFAYTTSNASNIVYKIKEKKWIELQLKFYSDELDKPFGIYDAFIEAFVGGYVKR